jgi:LPXTG-motif cell wall-anchored protein
VTVSEGTVPVPPQPEGYTCSIIGEPMYSVNGAEFTTVTPDFALLTEPNTVVVRNAVDCTPIPTTSLKVIKVWTYVDVPANYPELTTADAGTLAVTVGGTGTGQAWGQTVTDLDIGAAAVVTEGTVPTPPQVNNYVCSILGSPTYAVNGAAPTSQASFDLLATANTVVVTNTVTCSRTTPPSTTLQVTKEWVYGTGVPAGYPQLTSGNAGVLTVTVAGQATGQGWNAVQAGLPINGAASVLEATVPAVPQVDGYTCSVVGAPAYAVNGGALGSTAEFTLLPTANAVVVRNVVDCTLVVEPIEPIEPVVVPDEDEPVEPVVVPEEKPDSNATLPRTGADGAASIALLATSLLLVGAAVMVASRRRSEVDM